MPTCRLCKEETLSAGTIICDFCTFFEDLFHCTRRGEEGRTTGSPQSPPQIVIKDKSHYSIKQLKEFMRMWGIPSKGLAEKQDLFDAITNTILDENNFLIYRMNKSAAMASANNSSASNASAAMASANSSASNASATMASANNSYASNTNPSRDRKTSNTTTSNPNTTPNTNANTNIPSSDNPFDAGIKGWFRDVSTAFRDASTAFRDASTAFKTQFAQPSSSNNQASSSNPPANQSSSSIPPANQSSSSNQTNSRPSSQATNPSSTTQATNPSSTTQFPSNNVPTTGSNNNSTTSQQRPSSSRSTNTNTSPSKPDPNEIDPPSITELATLQTNLSTLSTKALKRILLRERVSTLDIDTREQLLDRVGILVRNVGRELVNKESDQDVCKVCFDGPINCVLLECGHMCCWYLSCSSINISSIECAEQLYKTTKECLICRSRITRIIHTFKA